MQKQNKQTKILGFLGNGIMHARIGLCTHDQAYARRQDYAYVSPCLKNLKLQKTKHKQEKPNSNNLACSDPRQNYILTQTNAHKHKPN